MGREQKKTTYCNESGNRSHVFINQLHRVVDHFRIGDVAFICLVFSQRGAQSGKNGAYIVYLCSYAELLTDLLRDFFGIFGGSTEERIE